MQSEPPRILAIRLVGALAGVAYLIAVLPSGALVDPALDDPLFVCAVGTVLRGWPDWLKGVRVGAVLLVALCLPLWMLLAAPRRPGRQALVLWHDVRTGVRGVLPDFDPSRDFAVTHHLWLPGAEP